MHRLRLRTGTATNSRFLSDLRDLFRVHLSSRGIFATYDSVLATAGPVGIWLWAFAAVGQTLVALVVAQFAARIALSGSSYQWASRLANPKIGWLSAELAHLSHTPPDRWNGRAGDLPARLRIRLVDRLGDVHTVNL
jgi:hypothetical protein